MRKYNYNPFKEDLYHILENLRRQKNGRGIVKTTNKDKFKK
jgi:hypothetical protein